MTKKTPNAYFGKENSRVASLLKNDHVVLGNQMCFASQFQIYIYTARPYQQYLQLFKTFPLVDCVFNTVCVRNNEIES